MAGLGSRKISSDALLALLTPSNINKQEPAEAKAESKEFQTSAAATPLVKITELCPSEGSITQPFNPEQSRVDQSKDNLPSDFPIQVSGTEQCQIDESEVNLSSDSSTPPFNAKQSQVDLQEAYLTSDTFKALTDRISEDILIKCVSSCAEHLYHSNEQHCILINLYKSIN